MLEIGRQERHQFEQTISGWGESLFFGIQCLSVAHAIDVDGNGRLPPFSDRRYPSNCLAKVFTSTFGRYQYLMESYPISLSSPLDMGKDGHTTGSKGCPGVIPSKR
jgi:hypothetical protein